MTATLPHPDQDELIVLDDLVITRPATRVVSLLLMGAHRKADEQLLRSLVPEGLDPPADVPPPIFEAALLTFLDGHRIDMQALAGSLEISRSTLYRRVGDRDELLGAVLWFLTRHAVARSLATEDEPGIERYVARTQSFMADISKQEAFRRFIDQEPEAALRILTSAQGPIQSRLVDVTRRLLDHEAVEGDLALSIDHETLAYVIVRIAESFLYADVIARGTPDIGLAVRVIRRLLVEPT